MDSETFRIFGCIGLVVCLLFFLILNFANPTYTKTLCTVLIVVTVIMSYLGGMLLSYGKTYAFLNFIISLFFFCIAPLAIAGFIHYFIINGLKSIGLLSTRNIALFFGVIVLLITYLRLGMYNWKTYTIKQDKALKIDVLAVKLLGTEPYEYDTWFFSNSYLFNFNRVNAKKKRWQSHVYQAKGTPKGIALTYFSEKEQQLYKGEFEFPEKQIKKLMGFGLFHSSTDFQKYNHINLLFFSKGEISLQLGNSNTDVTFFEGVCEPINAVELSSSEENTFENKASEFNLNELKYIPYINENLDIIRKQKTHIKHTITGLTGQIVSINVITANGERYALDKKYWNGKNLAKKQSPIVAINYIIINNKGKKLSWEYVYDIKDIASHVKQSSINIITDLEYKFDLSNNENGLLKANNYEYINNVKNEFKLNMEKTKIYEVSD